MSLLALLGPKESQTLLINLKKTSSAKVFIAVVGIVWFKFIYLMQALL